MDKTKLKDLIGSFKRALGRKDEQISDLSFKLKNKDAAAIIKMPEVVIPDKFKITNFPENQKTTITNLPDVQRVKIEGAQEIQKVELMNEKEVKFPEVQKVEVTNAEKASGWVPDVIKHAAVAIVAGLVKRLDMGIVVHADPEDKLRPQAVVVVDHKGRPVNLNSQGIMIPMPNSPGGSPIIAESLDQYHVSDADEAGSTKYYGFLTKEGAWYIMQNDTSANTYRYLKGSSGYTTAWTGRASATYGYFDVIF